jgi:hypothetical protein
VSRVSSEPPRSEPPRSERAKRSGALVSLAASGALVPSGCACCGEPAAKTALARAADGAELIVGYCDGCSAHIGRESTRSLAGGVAAGLLGGGLALALPFAPRPLSFTLLALIVFLAATAPLVVVFAWPRRPAPGHAAEGPAVRFVGAGKLLCANQRFATELARLNRAVLERVAFSERRIRGRLFLIPVFAVVTAVVTLLASSPIVRIVNLGPERLFVDVDGHRVATVDPTSVEAPSAGVEVRVTAGPHEFVASTAEHEVLRESATVQSGHAHLFAPASEGYCFWLETAEYGRSRSGAVSREPLEGPAHFWVLPADLGGWFRPAPEQSVAEARLTGGVVTVLRQAPCGLDP